MQETLNEIPTPWPRPASGSERGDSTLRADAKEFQDDSRSWDKKEKGGEGAKEEFKKK